VTVSKARLLLRGYEVVVRDPKGRTLQIGMATDACFEPAPLICVLDTGDTQETRFAASGNISSAIVTYLRDYVQAGYASLSSASADSMLRSHYDQVGWNGEFTEDKLLVACAVLGLLDAWEARDAAASRYADSNLTYDQLKIITIDSAVAVLHRAEIPGRRAGGTWRVRIPPSCLQSVLTSPATLRPFRRHGGYGCPTAGTLIVNGRYEFWLASYPWYNAGCGTSFMFLTSACPDREHLAEVTIDAKYTTCLQGLPLDTIAP